MKQDFPDIIKHMVTLKYERYVLTQVRSFVEQQYKHGDVEAKQKDVICHEINLKISRLAHRSVKFQDVKPRDIILSCKVLNQMFGKDFCKSLADLQDKKTEEQHESKVIQKKGKPGKSIYIVLKGKLIESETECKHNMGD